MIKTGWISTEGMDCEQFEDEIQLAGQKIYQIDTKPGWKRYHYDYPPMAHVDVTTELRKLFASFGETYRGYHV
jgi:hypothetical protein